VSGRKTLSALFAQAKVWSVVKSRVAVKDPREMLLLESDPRSNRF
jgi:hypothetical protein